MDECEAASTDAHDCQRGDDGEEDQSGRQGPLGGVGITAVLVHGLRHGARE